MARSKPPKSSTQIWSFCWNVANFRFPQCTSSCNSLVWRRPGAYTEILFWVFVTSHDFVLDWGFLNWQDIFGATFWSKGPWSPWSFRATRAAAVSGHECTIVHTVQWKMGEIADVLRRQRIQARNNMKEVQVVAVFSTAPLCRQSQDQFGALQGMHVVAKDEEQWLLLSLVWSVILPW